MKIQKIYAVIIIKKITLMAEKYVSVWFKMLHYTDTEEIAIKPLVVGVGQIYQYRFPEKLGDRRG